MNTNTVEQSEQAGPPRGEDHFNAKLTEAIVREIRALHVSGGGGLGYDRLAAKFKISKGAVMRVVRRITWAHVK